jgi:nucleoid DNA-binding protein
MAYPAIPGVQEERLRFTDHKERADMTKAALERPVADAAGVEKCTAASVLDVLQDVVTSTVRRGEGVTIRPGFIKVTRKDVKARKGARRHESVDGGTDHVQGQAASKTAKVTAL